MSPVAALLAELDRALTTLAHPDLPAALGELERLKATVWARLATPANGNGSAPEPAAEDRLLTADEAAARLGTTPRWLRRHAGRLPFARRLSRKTLRYSEAGLTRWLAARKLTAR